MLAISRPGRRDEDPAARRDLHGPRADHRGAALRAGGGDRRRGRDRRPGRAVRGDRPRRGRPRRHHVARRIAHEGTPQEMAGRGRSRPTSDPSELRPRRPAPPRPTGRRPRRPPARPPRRRRRCRPGPPPPRPASSGGPVTVSRATRARMERLLRRLLAAHRAQHLGRHRQHRRLGAGVRPDLGRRRARAPGAPSPPATSSRPPRSRRAGTGRRAGAAPRGPAASVARAESAPAGVALAVGARLDQLDVVVAEGPEEGLGDLEGAGVVEPLVGRRGRCRSSAASWASSAASSGSCTASMPGSGPVAQAGPARTSTR